MLSTATQVLLALITAAGDVPSAIGAWIRATALVVVILVIVIQVTRPGGSWLVSRGSNAHSRPRQRCIRSA